MPVLVTHRRVAWRLRMARVSDLLAAGRTFSFEFFPPKTDSAQLSLGRTIAELEPLAAELRLGDLRRRWQHPPADPGRRHVGPPRDGHHADGPPDLPGPHPRRDRHDPRRLPRRRDREHPGPRRRSADRSRRRPAERLHVRRRAGRGHRPGRLLDRRRRAPGDPSAIRRIGDSDRRHLAAKLPHADFAITQFFFEIEPYLRLVDELAELGVDKPVLPGIMPVTNAGQVARMAAMSGAEIPAWLVERLDGVDDPTEVRRIGVDVGVRAVRRAARCRRARAALLHAQPQHGDPGDLRQPRARSSAARRMTTSITRPLEWHPPRAAISAVPYLPGLDGMRAIAVAAVMVYHANNAVAARWLPRRRGLLRDQRLPHHAAADRRARAHRLGQPAPLLPAPGPTAAARRCSRC